LVGTLTGFLCAVYPYWIFNTAELNDGSLVTFLVGLAVFLGVRGGQNGGALTSLLYGLSLAALSCVRAALFPFAIVAALWFLFRCRTLPRGWLYAVLAFLGFINGLIPITAWHYQTFRTPVPIVDSAYLRLWIGNNPQATGGPVAPTDLERVLSDQAMEDGRTRLEDLQQKRQPERYQDLARDIWTEVQNHPGETFKRRLRAGLGFFLSSSWLEGNSLVRDTGVDRAGLPEWVDQLLPSLLPGTIFFLLLLAALGWRWSHGWKYEAMPSSLAVMWIPLPYLLSYADAYHGPRLPLDGILLSYAALAVVYVLPVLGNSVRRGEDSLRSDW
jgi:hypothetical protein